MGQFLGHLGGALMVLFVVLLALRCAKRLGLLFWSPAPVRSVVPCWKPSLQMMVLTATGVVVLQLLFAFICWLELGQSGGLSAFWRRFVERFSTAGDSVHYLNIARYGYLAEGEAAKYIVFYPLYPLVVRLVHTLLSPFSVSWECAALAISWLCWGGAGAAMLVLAGQDLNREQSITAAALMALYPFSFFALGIYTESLFLLLCLLCMITARRQNWLWAGVWGALAALCRNQGLVLILPLLYLWLRARREKKQGLVSLCILFPFLGWGSYLALNARLFGDPFAFLEFQAAPPWYQSIKWIGSNLMQHWQMALKYPGLAPFIYHAQLVLYFAAMALLFIGFWRKAPTHWLIWGGAYLGMCYLAGWLISGGRYLFGCLPLYLIVSSLPRPARWALLAINLFFFWRMGIYYMQGQAIM